MPKNPSIPTWEETEEIIPSWEQTSELTKEEAPSDLEAALRGAAQGATFEFSDEATAALESALTGKPYEQALAESRAKYKAAKEAAPVAYGTGELAGAVGSAFIPGIGAVGQVAKGATLGAKVLGGLKAGALAGGLTGLGASEESLLEKPREVLTEGLTGAGVGAAVGGVAPIAIAGLGKVGEKVGEFVTPKAEAFKKGLGEFVAETPLLNIPKEIFKESAAGTKLGAKATRKGLQESTKESVDTLQEIVKTEALNIDDLVNVVDEQLANKPKLKISNLIDEVSERLKDPDISSDEKNDLSNIYQVLKQSGQVKTVSKFEPTGPVLPGTVEKETQKMTSKLSAEKAKLISQIEQLKQLQTQQAEELTPALNEQIDDQIKSIQSKIEDIDKAPKTTVVPEMGQDVLTAILKKPEITEEAGVELGKSIGKTLPTEVGERTPIKLTKEAITTRPELSATESRELQAEMYRLGMPKSKAGEILKEEILSKAKEGMARGDETLKEAVDLANKQFSLSKNIMENLGLEETALSQDVPYMEAMGDIKKNYEKLFETSRKAAASDIVPTESNKKAYDELIQSLNNLRKINPESADIMEKKLLKSGKQAALSEEIVKPRLLGSKDIGALFGGALGLTYRGAQAAGKVTKFLTDLPSDQLKQAAAKLTGNSKVLLEKIADTNDRTMRNALIYTAMQRPEFRKDLNISEEEK